MPENVNKICKVCGDNCDCGRYIGKYFDAEKYNTYMSIPDTIQEQIADYLFKQLEIEKCKGKTIEVFTAGVGPGRIEIPFILKCLEKGVSLCLTAVDLDTGMLRKFYDNILTRFEKGYRINGKSETKYTNNNFNGKEGIHHFSININDSVQIVAFCGNLENLSKKHYYTGSSDFYVGEFVLPLTIEKLCEVINNNNYNVTLQATINTIAWLNEFLAVPNFYDILVQEKPEGGFSEHTKKLVEKTKDYRNKSFSDLSNDELDNIKRLNRLLLEETYPQETPKSRKKHYDYIFSIFVLHAITNWEEPLYHLLRMLKPGGKIVFAEEIGDVNWLDNHFDDIEKYGRETEEEVRKKYSSSDFYVGEFVLPLTIEKLCVVINNDNYNVTLQATINTIAWLNEFLAVPNFYNILVREGIESGFSEHIKKLVEKTKDYRNKSFSDLNKDEQDNIKRLNRLLLEETYPQETPKSHKSIINLHRKFWKEYHRARKEGLGKEWAKDTKASDLGVIETCFQRMEDLDLFENSSPNKNIRWVAEVPFTFYELLEWVSGKKFLYTPLSYGLACPKNNNNTSKEKLKKEILEINWNEWKDKNFYDFHKVPFTYKDISDDGRDFNLFDDKDVSDQDALGIYMEWWLKKVGASLDENIPRIEGHEFHIYTKNDKYNAKKDDRIIHTILYGNIVNLHRLKERIAQEIHSIPGHYEGKVPPQELTHRLFTLRDMYLRLFPFTHSLYTKWGIESAEEPSKGKLLTKEMPLLLTFPILRKKNGNLSEDLVPYFASYILYNRLALIEKEDTDLNFTEFIFREMPEKFPVIINKTGDASKPFITFSQVPLGNIRSLEVSIPTSTLEEIFNQELIGCKNSSSKFFSIKGSINYLSKQEASDIKEFIENKKFFKNQGGNTEHQDFLLFSAESFSKCAKDISSKHFDNGNRERFKKAFRTCFENVKIKSNGRTYIKAAEDRFKDITRYNEWEKNIEFEEFLLNIFLVAIIGYSTEHAWDIFAKYPGKCFVQDIKAKDTEKTYKREEGVGGFIIMRKKVNISDENENKRLEEIFRKNHEGMLFLISGLWSRNDSILEWGRLTKETMRKHGTKAAVAAIMGRNMSHNIGSHVLHYLSQNDRYYGYIQSRVDFIAELAMSEPLWTMGMSLIKDILNPLMGVEEDDSALPNQRVKVGYSQYCHWGNIVRSEFINPNGDVDAFFCAKKIKLVLKHDEHIVTYKVNDNNRYFSRERGSNFDPFIDIPHGLIGAQAFYSLIENILRNTAKYRENKGEELTVYIEFKEPEGGLKDQFCEIIFWDNSIIPENKREEITEIIFGNEHKKGALNDTFIKEDGSINKRWLGFKEMRICAGWLRMLNTEEIDTPNEPPLLDVDRNELGKNGRIIYKIFCFKPLNMLIISPPHSIRCVSEPELNSKGVYLADNIQVVNAMIKEKRLRHSFIIFNTFSSEEQEWLKCNLSSLPYRILVKSNNNCGDDFIKSKVVLLPEKFDFSGYENLMDKIYIEWLKWLNNNKTPPSLIYRKGENDILRYVIDNDNNISTENNENEVDNYLIKNASNLLIFDHNAALFNKIQNPLYYEPYRTGLGTVGVRLTIGKTMVPLLIEAAIVKVIIADERIYNDREGKHPYFAGIGLNEYWRFAGINIINILKTNNSIIKVKNEDGNEKLLKEFIENIPNEKYTFFLIHQGLIDEEIGYNEFEKEIMPLLQKKVKYIIIHSGKGEPERIPDGAKFIEFSNIKRFIVDNPDKHLLIFNMLMKLAFYGNGNKK